MSAITRARFLRGDWGARPLSPSPDALARISGLCLAFRAVHCRSCLEACEPEAIRFLPRLGGVSTPRIIFRHIAPNLVGVVIVYATLTVPAGTDVAKAEKLLEKAESACLITNSMSCETHLKAEVISAG